MLIKLAKESYSIFIPMPGDRLDVCIKQVILYCKENNCQSELEFNGCTHFIYPDSDDNELHKHWYDGSIPSREEQIRIRRDSRINDILK